MLGQGAPWQKQGAPAPQVSPAYPAPPSPGKQLPQGKKWPPQWSGLGVRPGQDPADSGPQSWELGLALASWAAWVWGEGGAEEGKPQATVEEDRPSLLSPLEILVPATVP